MFDNPLEIPELVWRISRYVTTNDAIACSRVCKTWSDHFVSEAWHTIDFALHEGLLKVNIEALARNGHHIRVVKSVKEHNHIMALTISNPSKLRQLSIIMAATQQFYANFSDLLRRINTNIEHLEILQPLNKSTPFFTVDSIIAMPTGATSKLSFIELQGLTMTRDAFSSLLKTCPSKKGKSIMRSPSARLFLFTLPMLLASENTLELPGLLKRISRFVTLNDAIACVQVCKAWSDHFASAIWHTIDFAVHDNLHQMDAKVLARYGHHIRIVRNMKEHYHIMVLIVSNASNLRELFITMTATHEFYAKFNDLLRRVRTGIEGIEIWQPPSDTAPFFSFDSLLPNPNTSTSSKLSTLTIEGLNMTRDSFSSLLRACPALDHLTVRDTIFSSWLMYDQDDTHYHRHTGLSHLTAPIEQVFKMDNQSKNAPSLFVHFPTLEIWQTWSSSGSMIVSVQDLRKEVALYCPALTALLTSAPAPMTIDMLTHVFGDLTVICILNEYLSAEMVVAILEHYETLHCFITYVNGDGFYDSEAIPEVGSTPLDTSGWIIQPIPRLCTRLKTLQFPLFEMDMEDIEKVKWGCHDLEELHVRVRNLNTKEKIERVIQLWKEGQITARRKEGNGESICSCSRLDKVIPPSDNSIEARVARHLLKFKKLRKVWLGWKIRKVA